MKIRDKVKVIATQDAASTFLVGKVGTVTYCFNKSVWDDEEVPEYSVSFEDIEDENGEMLVLSDLWFTALEIEKV